MIKNRKNSAYKNQYGAVGKIKKVSKSPPLSVLTAPEKTVFRSHVAKVKTKYGTPRVISFLSAWVFHTNI